MTGWIVLLTYLAGFALSGVLIARWLASGEDRVEPKGVWELLLLGYCAATIWPAWWPIRIVYRLLTRQLLELLKPPAQRAREEAHELNALRAQARALGLPFPGDEATELRARRSGEWSNWA